MQNVSVKLSNYSNIERIVKIMDEQDKERMNFILGIRNDKSIVNLSVFKRKYYPGHPITYYMSGIIYQKYFDFCFTLKQYENELVIESIDHNCDGMYISLSTLNKLILNTDKYNDFKDYDLNKYHDIEYLNEMNEGLKSLLESSKNTIVFKNELEINIKELYCLKNDTIIYRFTFSHSKYPKLSASVYYRNNDSEFKIISGYVSEYVESKSLISDKYIEGYNIDRDIIKTIEVIKDLRI